MLEFKTAFLGKDSRDVEAYFMDTVWMSNWENHKHSTRDKSVDWERRE